jgi:adenylosuccinate synthase
MVQGATEVALTLLDVLGYLDEIPVCTHYRIDRNVTQQFPVPSLLDTAQPVLEVLPGWKQDISRVREFSDLPKAAQRYVETVEQLVGVPIRWISVGSSRDAIIRR